MAAVPTAAATFKDLIDKFERRAAVGDADHDFKGSRVGTSIFNKVYNTNNFKAIGAPQDNLAGDVLDEFHILSMIFPFHPDPKIETFRALLKTEGGVENDLGEFLRFQGDSPYKVTAVNILTKNGGSETWHKSSEKLYDFLNPHDRPEIAFTIDACNIPFYRQLVEQDMPVGKSAKAIYLLPREGINDAAGKVDLTKKAGITRPLEIETREDTAPYHVLYPALDMTNPNPKELETFFSNFNLSVTPVSNEGKVPAITLNITSKDFKRQVQVLKHSKEDAHPNAVPTLAAYINKLIGKLLPGPINQNDKIAYFAALQQKRSGDWLQVLACLQPERFNLPSNTRPMLFTLDKICVAYALFAGIDVCMTYKVKVGNVRKYWLIRFHKSSGGTPLTSVNKLRSQIETFYKKTDIVPEEFKRVDVGDPYGKYKVRYREQWDAINADLSSKCNKLLDLTISRSSKSAVENSVKDILYALTTLCVFRSIVPQLKDSNDNVQVQLLSAGGNESVVRESFNAFCHNFMAIKEAVDGMAKKSGVTSGEQAINAYFNTLSSKNGPLTAANKKRRVIIDKLKIFDKLFIKGNADTNGVGIFTFLNQALTDPEKENLIDTLNKFSVKLEGKEQGTYKVFLDTLKYLTFRRPEEVDIPIESGPLLESIDNSMYEIPDGSRVSPAEVAAAAEAAPGAAAAPAVAAPGAAAAAENAVDVTIPVVQEGDDERRIEEIKAQVIKKFKEAEQAPTEAERLRLIKDAESKEGEYLRALNEKAIKDTNEQVDTSIQVSDYGAALSLLKIKKGITDEEGRRLLDIEKREEYAVRENQEGGGAQDIAKYKYYHNPLTSFYFLFRELGWRLAQPDRDDHEDCIRLCKLLEEFIFNTPKSKHQQISNYLYWLDIEKYLLYFDSKHHYTNCDPHFIDDIMFTVREVYLGRPVETDETYYSIDKSLIEAIQSFSFDEVTNEEQIQENLKIMRRIIDTIYKVEEFFDAPLVAQPVNMRVNTRRNNRRRLFNSPKNKLPAFVSATAGGSRRKYRNSKRKDRRHNRQTKKRKNV